MVREAHKLADAPSFLSLRPSFVIIFILVLVCSFRCWSSALVLLYWFLFVSY